MSMTRAGPNWPYLPLGDICQISIGRTPARSRRDYWGPGFLWLSIADMNQGRDIVTTTETITDVAVRECNCRLVPTGTVLLSFKLSVGKVGIARRPMFTNEAIAALPITDPSKILPDFLYWSLRSIDLAHGGDRAAKGVTLNSDKLHRVRIPLPPVPEQRRIVEFLDKSDALRAKRRTGLAQLDTLIKSIFLDMFGDPATNPNRFPRKRLDALVRQDDSINYGVVQPGDHLEEGIPLIRVGDLQNGKVDQTALKRISPTIEAAYKRSRLRGDEILISCVGSTGTIALADESVRGFNIARAVARVALAESIDRTYVANYLQSHSVQRYFANELRTVSQPTLNIKQICETSILVPPLDLQRKFAQRVNVVTQLRERLFASLEGLEAMFGSIQTRAFRGQL